MNLLTYLGASSMAFCAWFTWHTATSVDDGKGQSKRASITEAWVNIAIGFTINFVANFWLIPMMTGVELSNSANFWGGWIYTTISMSRSYVIRRWFNDRIHLFAKRFR